MFHGAFGELDLQIVRVDDLVVVHGDLDSSEQTDQVSAGDARSLILDLVTERCTDVCVDAIQPVVEPLSFLQKAGSDSGGTFSPSSSFDAIL